jgi:branched-chain amino acid transport system ATP-binding protein
VSGSIRLVEVHASYGKLEVLRGVSFEVASRDFVALIGANGAGKSTALKAIVGIIPLRSGAVYLGKRDVRAWSTKKRLENGIAYVPQGNKVFGSMTVRENLELISYDYEEAVGLFPNISEKLDLKAASLSGGEQQMLSIARALLLKPKFLLLDEPSIGLSPLFVNVVFDVLEKINAAGIGILVVEQNVKKALMHAHHGFLLEQGIVKRKVTRKDLQDPDFGRAYLGI